MAFQPVPTYADPVLVDEKTKKSGFNPVWLSWFLGLTDGGLSGTITHNGLQGLQGGFSGQYYHLSLAEYGSIVLRNDGLPSGIIAGPSPFTYQNADLFDEDVIVDGGSVSDLTFTRDGITFYTIGVTQGMIHLSPGDSLIVTYSSAPTLTKVPRFAGPEDAEAVEAICGDSEVRAWTASDGAGKFVAAPWLRPPHMVVIAEGACFLANHLGDHTYGVHTHILKERRGKEGLVTAGLSLMLAFLASNAETLNTMVPSNNVRAEWFTREMGFRPTFKQKEKFLHGGVLRDLNHYTMTVDDWILQGHLIAVGQAFHREVEERFGAPSHPEDPVHDAYVGAAVAMINSGKPLKALKIYNRWARAAGYVPIRVISTNPLALDARDFIIKVIEGKMILESKEMENA